MEFDPYLLYMFPFDIEDGGLPTNFPISPFQEPNLASSLAGINIEHHLIPQFGLPVMQHGPPGLSTQMGVDEMLSFSIQQPSMGPPFVSPGMYEQIRPSAIQLAQMGMQPNRPPGLQNPIRPSMGGPPDIPLLGMQPSMIQFPNGSEGQVRPPMSSIGIQGPPGIQPPNGLPGMQSSQFGQPCMQTPGMQGSSSGMQPPQFGQHGMQPPMSPPRIQGPPLQGPTMGPLLGMQGQIGPPGMNPAGINKCGLQRAVQPKAALNTGEYGGNSHIGILPIHLTESELGLEIQELNEKWNSPRYHLKSRPYNAFNIISKRSRIKSQYVSNLMARKLWKTLKVKQCNKEPLLTFGVVDFVQAIHASKYLDAILVSGEQTSIVSNTHTEPSPMKPDYPLNTVPLIVEHIFMVQEFYDRKQREGFYNNLTSHAQTIGDGGQGSGEMFDYLKPIIGEADNGHGGITTTMHLTKMLVQRGAAAIHIDDQALGSQSNNNLLGKVIVPTFEQKNRLIAVRAQLDILGTDQVIICRSCANEATLITGDSDKRDQPYILGATVPLSRLAKTLEEATTFGASDERLFELEREWLKEAKLMSFPNTVALAIAKRLMPDKQKMQFEIDQWLHSSSNLSLDEQKDLAMSMGIHCFWSADHARTTQGYFRFDGSIQAVIERAKSYGQFTDVLTIGAQMPDIKEAEQFSKQVLMIHSDLLLGYEFPTSYNWDAPDVDDAELEALSSKLSSLGFILQTIGMAGVHSDALIAEQFSKDYSRRGILAYLEDVQRPTKFYNNNALADHFVTGSDYYNRLNIMVTKRNKINVGGGDIHDQMAQSHFHNYLHHVNHFNPTSGSLGDNKNENMEYWQSLRSNDPNLLEKRNRVFLIMQQFFDFVKRNVPMNTLTSISNEH